MDYTPIDKLLQQSPTLYATVDSYVAGNVTRFYRYNVKIRCHNCDFHHDWDVPLLEYVADEPIFPHQCEGLFNG